MLAILAICASFIVARADVKYTMVTKYTTSKTPYQPSSLVEETDTLFVAPGKTRLERGYSQGKENMQGQNLAPPKEISITRCDLHQEFFLDDSLKIYFVSTEKVDSILKPPAVKGYS